MRIGVNGVIPYVSLKIFGSCWGFQSTRVTDPQLFSCGSPDPQGQRHSYFNGMGHPKPLIISFFFPENFILIAQTDVFFENPH